MQTKPLPEIDRSELKAVRRFLTSVRDEDRPPRAGRPAPATGGVPLRIGIARARMRHAAKPDAR
jgi:hypothetical protein